MTVRKVIRMGNPTLREEALPFTKEEILGEQTEQLLIDLVETMEEESGIGIAAPQIGVLRQLTLIAIGPDQSRYPESEETPLLVVFNPIITVLDDELQGFWEGCLSVPGLRGYVERPRKVQIDYLDQDAKEQTIVVEDFLATVFQHEIDHLLGKLYIDRITDTTKLCFNEEYSEFWVNDPSEQSEEEEEKPFSSD